MNREFSVGIDSVQSHLDDPSNTVFINLMHAEGFDLMLLQDAFLGGIDVPQTNIHEPVSPKHGFYPGELRLVSCDAKEEGQRHAVDTSCGTEVPSVSWASDIRSCEMGQTRITGLGSVNVSMSINPNDTGVGVN